MGKEKIGIRRGLNKAPSNSYRKGMEWDGMGRRGKERAGKVLGGACNKGPVQFL
jgi:hypothetical protein